METSLSMPGETRRALDANARWFLLWSAVAGVALATGNQLMPRYLAAAGLESSDVIRLTSWPALVATLTALPSAYFVHRLGSVRFLLLGVLVTVAAGGLATVTTSPAWLAPMLVVRTCSTTVVAVSGILVMAENSEGHERVRLFCYAAGLGSLSYVLAPFIGAASLNGATAFLGTETVGFSSHRVTQAVLALALVLSVLPLIRIKPSADWRRTQACWRGEELLQMPRRLVRLFLPLATL